MSKRYEVIVIGVGGMGSAAAYHLASRGIDTLGIERFDIPHSMGSSHGITRIIRRGQYENPEYVPLAERSYELWRELEAITDRDLLHVIGGVDAGPPEGEVFPNSRESCREHNIEHEILSGREVNERFPGYEIPADHKAVYQPESGFLVPEQCIIAHVEAAQERGAEIHARERVLEVSTDHGSDVRVETDHDTYRADQVIVTAGAWAREFAPELADKLVPVRQVLAWLQPSDPSLFDPASFPIFIHETETERYYGFPRFDVPGFKFARFNHFAEEVDPDEMPREPRKEDEDMLRAYARRYFPEGAGPTMQLSTCLFTNTPDGHFILDTAPGQPKVTLGAGFSGHGFKFASAIGEILADLALDGETDHNIELFLADRFDGDSGI